MIVATRLETMVLNGLLLKADRAGRESTKNPSQKPQTETPKVGLISFILSIALHRKPIELFLCISEQ